MEQPQPAHVRLPEFGSAGGTGGAATQHQVRGGRRKNATRPAPGAPHSRCRCCLTQALTAVFAPAYLDHNATTPVLPAVLETMLPFFGQSFGNASSRHDYGRAALRAVDEARQQVAVAVGAHPTEVVFTSGGSEANNLFLKGAAACMKPGLVAISAVEHPSVREAARDLVRTGWTLREIAVDPQGRVDAADYAGVLERRPALASGVFAHNETGGLQDVG